MSKNNCKSTAYYCGQKFTCSQSNCGPQSLFHSAYSMRYSHLAWSDNKRAQPAAMFHSGHMGTVYGSHEADSMVMAAAQMQDAVNRLEYLQSRKKNK